MIYLRFKQKKIMFEIKNIYQLIVYNRIIESIDIEGKGS